MVQSSSPGAAGGAPEADQPGSDPQRRAGRPLRGRARPRWSRRCSPRPAPITRAGRVEDGTTVTRLRRGRAPPAALGLASRSPRSCTTGVKVNLLDTPGYADFVGDLRAGLRAADARCSWSSAVDGVDGATQLLWEECAAVGMPRAVVDHQARQGPRRLRRGRGDLPAGLRRRRAAALPADGRRRRHRGRADRPAVPAGLRLLQRHAGRARPGPRAPAADRDRAQRADRGDHRRVRGRDA